MGQGSASEVSADAAQGAAPSGRSAARPWLQRVLGVLPPEVSPPAWHVSPAVDVVAYHFSWVLMLAPLLLLGDRHPTDYRFLLILAVAGNFAHQALSLPLVYLDREVARRESRRVLYLPLAMLILFVVSVIWWRLDVPRHTTFGLFILPLAALSFVWNFWHVYMQKYGILRLYDAKAVRAGSPAVPGHVDRLFVFGWLPLTVAVIGPRYRDFLVRNFPMVDGPVRLILEGLDRAGPLPLLLGALAAAGSLGSFLFHELRSHGLGCRPRLSAALGMTLLSLSLLVVNPIKAVIAFGFSHVLEYLVFAWAFQRRRHAAPHPESPLLARLMLRPALAIGLFALVVSAGIFLVHGWTFYIRPGVRAPELLGVPLWMGVDLLAIFLSMSHFWFDGFLWKMRRADVRGSI